MKEQLQSLCEFLGGLQDESIFFSIKAIKQKALELDTMRVNDEISGAACFEKLISCSDLHGNMAYFENSLTKALQTQQKIEYTSRIAMIGLPPIYHDFHELASSFGLHIVYDELPYEFVRIQDTTLDELAKNYATYTFSRNLRFRLGFLKKELAKRDIDGVIHYPAFIPSQVRNNS